MARPIRRAGGLFAEHHRALVGDPIDFSSLDTGRHAPALLARARATWQQRFTTELRSVQIMTRFVTEVVSGGDPIDVYAWASELVTDEIRHTSLCAQVCEALGHRPTLPEPLELRDPPTFLQAPMQHRSIATAISMLLINETLSVGFVSDLAERCTEPSIRAVLSQTVRDEIGHERLGVAYVEASLKRFPGSAMADFRHLVQTTLAPHRARVTALARGTLDDHPDTDLVALGLFSDERQALVLARTIDQTLTPTLARLGLA